MFIKGGEEGHYGSDQAARYREWIPGYVTLHSKVYYSVYNFEISLRCFH